MKKRFAPLLAAVSLLIIPAGAGVVTSLPGGSIVAMPTLNVFGCAPQVFSGITWSSTNCTQQGGSVFGYTGGYGFLGNGSWDAAIGPMAGLNDSFDVYGVTDTMTFTLPSPVAGIGGFLNYVPGSSHPTTIAVYDSSHTLIESFNLTFSTGGGNDTGRFYGFLEASPTIKYFTLTDNYVGIVNLTTTATSAVPEPGSMLMLGSGVLALIALRRKRLL